MSCTEMNLRRSVVLVTAVLPRIQHTLLYTAGGGACYQRVHKPEHFYSDSIDVWGMVENTLVGSYCLLACHHDDVMMIAILIPWTYQIMFENRLFPYC